MWIDVSRADFHAVEAPTVPPACSYKLGGLAILNVSMSDSHTRVEASCEMCDDPYIWPPLVFY
jgi:hypothetical protein